LAYRVAEIDQDLDQLIANRSIHFTPEHRPSIARNGASGMGGGACLRSAYEPLT
jgi:hypothetical protein